MTDCESKNSVIIFGGSGALGSKCVSHFKLNNWQTVCIDLRVNPEADFNILVTNTGSLSEQEETIFVSLDSMLNNEKFDAVLCVAGGWTSGTIKKDFAKNIELMWRQNVGSSVIAASIASRYLKEGGLLMLTGANSALGETPNMIGYGLAKAAVHHLTKSLAGNSTNHLLAEYGLPHEAICVSILPLILDTPMNRLCIPKSDTSAWTPLQDVVDLLWKWCNNIERPANGSLVQVITKDLQTRFNPVQGLWLDANTISS